MEKGMSVKGVLAEGVSGEDIEEGIIGGEGWINCG